MLKNTFSLLLGLLLFLKSLDLKSDILFNPNDSKNISIIKIEIYPSKNSTTTEEYYTAELASSLNNRFFSLKTKSEIELLLKKNACDLDFIFDKLSINIKIYCVSEDMLAFYKSFTEILLKPSLFPNSIYTVKNKIFNSNNKNKNYIDKFISRENIIKSIFSINNNEKKEWLRKLNEGFFYSSYNNLLKKSYYKINISAPIELKESLINVSERYISTTDKQLINSEEKPTVAFNKDYEIKFKKEATENYEVLSCIYSEIYQDYIFFNYFKLSEEVKKKYPRFEKEIFYSPNKTYICNLLKFKYKYQVYLFKKHFEKSFNFIQTKVSNFYTNQYKLENSFYKNDFKIPSRTNLNYVIISLE